MSAAPTVPVRTPDSDELRGSGKTPPRLIHIVDDRQDVARAIADRTPVVALCGIKWVPRRWKPSDGLRCSVCEDLAMRRYPVGPWGR